MNTILQKSEDGRIYIPLPHEAIEAITLELLLEDYKILMHSHKYTVGRLYENPKSIAAETDYQQELKCKQAFETLIEYYGG